MNLERSSRGVYSGPIDRLDERESAVPCPECGGGLLFIPAQEGPCHSGQFLNRCSAHWFCQGCAETFVERDATEVNEQ